MKKVLLLLLCVFVLSACKNSDNTSEPELKMLEVDLSIAPEKAEVNSNIIFEAKVTYGGEPVEDADEVKFEVWRSKSENHETIEVAHQENGVYVLEKSFAEEGTYYVYAHVTAEAMHAMPKKEFVVGEPSEPEDKSESKMMEDDSSEDEGHPH